MLDKQTRAAILELSKKGHGISEIARALTISRNSVRSVIESGVADVPAADRASVLDPHVNEIRELAAWCKAKRRPTNLVRVKEELDKRLRQRGEAIDVSYSAFTWFCREHGIGTAAKIPAAHIVTGPGEERQHDTSQYAIEIGGRKVKRHCASLVLGYLRMFFMQFYEKFDRFHMKIFLTDAFKFMDGVCLRCVIDNTSCAIILGSGSRAQVAPEVEAFEKRFGFHFLAHEIMHSDRKGKIENRYGHVENNFLVGRAFKDDADLNRQALEWVDRKNRNRMRELKASPLELFAAEKPRLVPLPIHIPEVYKIEPRCVDAFSCVSLHGEKYPAPAEYIGKEVLLRETKDRVIVLDGHKEIASHPKRVAGSPAPPPSILTPHRRSAAHLPEEDKLKAVGEKMTAYLSALKAERGPRYIWSVRKLFGLLCQYKAEDLEAACAKAHEYRLFDVRRVETMLLQDIAGRDYFLPLEFAARIKQKTGMIRWRRGDE